MHHILITGRRNAGKSTLIRALLEAIPVPVQGMITKKEKPDETGFSPVYIHRYGEPKRYTPENCVGRCREGHSVAYPEAFDRFSQQMPFPNEGVTVFDELGFLESNALRFTNAVLQTLDGAQLVIAAVRDKDTPFLNAVRAHPRAVVYRIDEENRDKLREFLLEELSVWFR